MIKVVYGEKPIQGYDFTGVKTLIIKSVKRPRGCKCEYSCKCDYKDCCRCVIEICECVPENMKCKCQNNMCLDCLRKACKDQRRYQHPEDYVFYCYTCKRKQSNCECLYPSFQCGCYKFWGGVCECDCWCGRSVKKCFIWCLDGVDFKNIETIIFCDVADDHFDSYIDFFKENNFEVRKIINKIEDNGDTDIIVFSFEDNKTFHFTKYFIFEFERRYPEIYKMIKKI